MEESILEEALDLSFDRLLMMMMMMLRYEIKGKKGKGKVYPIIGHEDPEGK